MKKRVLVVGAKGKMGSAVCESLKNDYEIIEFEKSDDWVDFSADLIVDFGSAESSVLSAEFARAKKIPLIVGSTEQSKEEFNKIRQTAIEIPLMICSNFSVGIVLVKSCIEQILKVQIEDICIFEKHHKRKKDAPSGTAISLSNFISERFGDKVQMLAERGGEEIGTHKVDFYFGDELVSIKHTAFSRKAFADGVRLAVSHMLGASQAKEVSFDEIVKKNFGLND